MLGQVDVQQEVVLHLVEQLEALPVAGVVEALHHLPQLRLQLQEQLKKASSDCRQCCGSWMFIPDPGS